MFWPKFRETTYRWLKKCETRSQLWGLDERQLEDIGVTRTDIDSVSRGTHPRCMT
jgi:uncharacterized protein YjiS (DUF1127 family)